jgi:hypothetical protein
MRESRTYGSVRGARDETRVPTATSHFVATAHVRCWPIASFRCRAAIRSLSDCSGHWAGFYEHAAYEPPLISARIFLISERKPGAMSSRASA